ncbi:MAG: PH domain-containing protein [Ilumatobacteraceae bacterium]
MTFAQKNLNANETIAVDLHPHWWYFASPVFALAVSIVLGIVVLANGADGWAGDTAKVILVVALGVSAVWLGARYIKWMNTHFVITSHRIIYRSGVVAKKGVEIPLERVNNVNFGQSVFERIVGAGDLLIESGGEDGQSRFSDIKHPDQVQRIIHSQMQTAMERRGGPASAPANVADQLERLEGMLQRGTLTPDEFELQKRKLLG